MLHLILRYCRVDDTASVWRPIVRGLEERGQVHTEILAYDIVLKEGWRHSVKEGEGVVSLPKNAGVKIKGKNVKQGQLLLSS